MKSAGNHINNDADRVQRTKFFRATSFFLAQHKFTPPFLLLFAFFCGAFLFAQEENNTSISIMPNTTVVGLEHLTIATKDSKEEKEQSTIYVVKNTILYNTQDLKIIIVEDHSKRIAVAKRKTSKVSVPLAARAKKETVPLQNKVQATQIPIQQSLPFDKKQTLVSSISTATPASTTFSKTNCKTFAVYNDEWLLDTVLLQKQKRSWSYRNSKPFSIKSKYCNRPPPASFC
ncbi:MAG: hypothetical protein L6262_06435 [Weeksellaceae bacterium]|nr:hypothetical protein [Weeksellaceae bacterium]